MQLTALNLRGPSMKHRPHNQGYSQQGFTLLECIIVAILIGTTLSWTVPNIRRQLIRQSVNNYVLRIEAGLQSLRMKQAVMKTSCVMQFPQEAITTVGSNSATNFLTPEQTIEVGKLTAQEKRDRLDCSNDPAINEGFRFLDTEQGQGTQDIELSFTQPQFTISPPGTSDDGGSLVILIRAKKHALLNPSLPIRCVEFTGNGLSRMGDWENDRCETR